MDPMSGTEALYHLRWNTDLGSLLALATDKGVARIFLRPPDLAAAIQSLRRKTDFNLQDEPSPLLEETAAQINSYLAGRRRHFDVPLDMVGTPFQMAVWRALKEIPFGQVVTYGQLARAVGRPKAARAVGQANGANPVPIIVPCHRVVASDGWGGFGSGIAHKLILLGLEGVTEADLPRARRGGNGG